MHIVLAKQADPVPLTLAPRDAEGIAIRPSFRNDTLNVEQARDCSLKLTYIGEDWMNWHATCAHQNSTIGPKIVVGEERKF